jgi:DNA-binding transcriptional MerR regulator/predicted transcriptional regulator YdeE
MLKIGHFARIGQVAIQALRYYDKLGLLKPAHVDRWTGYRFYTLEQLPRLHRILALKELGLSLEQIARLVEDDVSADEIRGMLRLKQAQLDDQLAELEGQRALVAARLRYLEQEGMMQQQDVVIKTVEPLLVASRRIIVTENVDHPVGLPEAFREVEQLVADQHAEADGACLAVWYTPVDATTNEDVEAAIPIKQAIAATGDVEVHELPREQVAAIVHQGDFRDFMRSYEAISRWIADNGYIVTGPFREIYHRFERGSNADTTVEIQFPVARAEEA